MTLDVTSLLGVLPVTSREITRDETSISWRKVKLRLSVSRSNAPSPESVHEDLPDYEDGPEASSHTDNRGGAEDGNDESEEEDELEEDNAVASDNEPSNPLPDSPPHHLSSALGLDFTSPIDLTQDDQDDQQVLSQLASIDLRDSEEGDSSSETRLREAEAFIASAVLQSQSLAPSLSPPSPPNEPLHEHHGAQSTTMTVRRVGRYETIYGLSAPDDEDGYFEVSRPGIARWSSSPTATTIKPSKTRPIHRELSLHPRLPSFLSVIPRYHRTYGSTWFKQNTRVKRVIEARERRDASNPAVGGAGTSFVKKAVERFGPTWRPRLPSVFDRVLKKTTSDSAVTVDTQVSPNSRSLVGEGIERPANVPRMADATGLTVPSTSMDAPLSIQSDTTMVVPDEEVPECTVVPSTPPLSLPHPIPPSTAQPPPQPPLPYLNTHSHSSTSQPDYPYPYIPTPPLDPISLPTPRLTREASVASTSTSFVPTPENGRVGLPTLPTLGVPEVLGTKVAQHGSPRSTSDDGVAYPYIATPPLPTAGLSVTSTPDPIVPSASFTPLPRTDASSIATHPQPIIPPPPTLTLPTLPPTAQPPPPPLSAVLPSFPVGQPPPPLPPLQPIIPPTLPSLSMTVQPPPLSAVLPSFPVGQPPHPLPPLVPPPTAPPRVPSLSVVPLGMTGTGYMHPLPPPPPPSLSGFFRSPESQMMTRPAPSSSVGSGSGSVPQSFMPPVGPSLLAIAPTPTLKLQTQLPPSNRIAEPEPESMDCREDAYAPLIVMTSPTQHLPRLDFVMGEESGLHAAPGREVPVGNIHLGSLDGEVTKHAVADVRTEGPSYQGALDSGYASRREGKGKGKHRATDEDGLDGDPPPFDKTDPLWEELLAYRADPNGDGLGSSPCVNAAALGQGLAEFLEGDPAGAFDLESPDTSWDFSAVLDSADSNQPDQPDDAVWKELCAWADEQPPEMLESVFGMLDTSESFVAEEPSVEPLGFGDFPPLDECQPFESLVPTITVESAEPSSLDYYPQLQVVQGANDEPRPSFTLDELDWDVMEEYAQLEDLECPSSSVDAARVMVFAIRTVAAKAKAGFAGTSDSQAFLPVVDFPSGPCGIVGGQIVSPSYTYVSLLDEDAQAPLVNSHYHQPSLPFTSLSHVMAAS